MSSPSAIEELTEALARSHSAKTSVASQFGYVQQHVGAWRDACRNYLSRLKDVHGRISGTAADELEGQLILALRLIELGDLIYALCGKGPLDLEKARVIIEREIRERAVKALGE